MDGNTNGTLVEKVAPLGPVILPSPDNVLAVPCFATVPTGSVFAGAPPPESVSPVPSPFLHQPYGLNEEMSAGTPLL